MLERDGYPAGVPCFVDISEPDPVAAAEFYSELFGWEFEDQMPADAPGHYFLGRLRGRDVAAVGSQSPGAPPPSWSTYICVDSAEDSVASVKEAGGSVLTEPFHIFDAGRMAVVADPDGAVFCLWQAQGHKGAQAVNEPGTWNWSDLHTRDPEGAKAFYGAVFGWEADILSFGETELTMLRLAGYGDFLAELEPGIRERQAGSGAPAGFEDAVAWLEPMTGDDVPPHWSVTFAVDDTDAIVERAVALGAGVLTAPFDAGPTRVAVLSDPQGAAFTVSKYDRQ